VGALCVHAGGREHSCSTSPGIQREGMQSITAHWDATSFPTPHLVSHHRPSPLRPCSLEHPVRSSLFCAPGPAHVYDGGRAASSPLFAPPLDPPLMAEPLVRLANDGAHHAGGPHWVPPRRRLAAATARTPRAPVMSMRLQEGASPHREREATTLEPGK